MSDQADPTQTDPMEAMKNAILFLANELEASKTRIDMLEDLVCNQVIGGIKGLFDDSTRSMGIDALKGRYGDKITPFEGAMPALGISDHYGQLYDHLQGKRGSDEAWGDENDDGEVDGILKALQERIDALRGSGSPASGGEGPAAVTIEKTTTEGAPSPAPDELIQTINRMKGVKPAKA